MSPGRRSLDSLRTPRMEVSGNPSLSPPRTPRTPAKSPFRVEEARVPPGGSLKWWINGGSVRLAAPGAGVSCQEQHAEVTVSSPPK
eukprot:68262-Prorocentrum_minimum.AAC.2